MLAVMRRRLLRLILAFVLALASLAVFTPKAEAFTPPYHIRNFSGSAGIVRIYANFGCSGSTHDLAPNTEAQSFNWDGIRAWRYFEVEVYDDKTGHFITKRKYAAGTCARAEGNIYFVDVF